MHSLRLKSFFLVVYESCITLSWLLNIRMYGASIFCIYIFIQVKIRFLAVCRFMVIYGNAILFTRCCHFIIIWSNFNISVILFDYLSQTDLTISNIWWFFSLVFVNLFNSRFLNNNLLIIYWLIYLILRIFKLFSWINCNNWAVNFGIFVEVFSWYLLARLGLSRAFIMMLWTQN